MADKHRVRRLAALLYWASWAAIVGIVGILLAIIVVSPPDAVTFRGEFPDLLIADDLPTVTRTAAIGVSLLPTLVWLWLFDRMRRLFGTYRQGDIITDDAATHIQRIGQGFLALAVLQFFYTPAMSLLLTSANPDGQHSLSLALNSDIFGSLIAAGLMILIGWAMRDASAVKAEVEAFV